ncbi:uncharacterized protein [Linepithema humile]|uniref:uncharacterized protein n=1 Tax=Linepithema humile TaxID=83485 RepID=UPI00062344AA|nr:PREDICTED: uncharacterized protein LOC105668090 [Linepithema humile]
MTCTPGGEIIAAISREGGYQADEIRLGRVQVTGRRGLNLAWAQCPADAALKLVEAGSMKIGWTLVRVELLPSRPAQCYRCLGRGHVQQRCPSNVDRAHCCYRCGGEGHTAGSCGERPHCPICALNGRPSGHRAGSTACPSIPPTREIVRGTLARSEGGRDARSQQLPLSAPDMETESVGRPSTADAKRPREDSTSPPQVEPKKARGPETDRPGSPQPGPSSGP